MSPFLMYYLTMHFIKAKAILSSRNGMNLYRGCTHGCIYCDSRSKCYQMDHEFTDIAVKENAIILLEEALKKKRRKCMISTGSMSDPYMSLEKELEYTRKALMVIDKYGFGATLITKSNLMLRDIDILKRINSKAKAVVQMTLTTADDNLCKIIEPNVCPTSLRVEALKKLNLEGISTVVWLSPILPFINDTKSNILRVIEMCHEANVKGIICFGMGLTLREGNREYYYKKLDKHFPALKEQYIKRYKDSYNVPSPNEKALLELFHERCELYGIMHNNDEIFKYLEEYEEKESQLTLF